MMIIEVETRLGVGAWWKMTSLGEFATVEEAEAKIAVLRRAMPMKEFRVLETNDEDIPF